MTRLEWERGSSTPGNLALGIVDDVELTEAVAGVIASDLADCGIGLNFAPVADVNTNPLNPVIGVRSFGSDPELVARHVAAFVRGTQARGVVACAKHFPGHGDTAVDSHLALAVAGGDLETALIPFRAAIEAGVGSIMTAHLVVPGARRRARDAQQAHPHRPAARRARLRRTGDQRCARDARRRRSGRRGRGGSGSLDRGRLRRPVRRTRPPRGSRRANPCCVGRCRRGRPHPGGSSRGSSRSRARRAAREAGSPASGPSGRRSRGRTGAPHRRTARATAAAVRGRARAAGKYRRGRGAAQPRGHPRCTATRSHRRRRAGDPGRT